MMQYEVKIPPTADGSLAVRMGKWLKKEGDAVRAGQDLAEATTEKITLYITSPADGVLAQIHVKSGILVQVGRVVAIIEGASG
jgi:pyruvate/2-oxoglutarate dehydrogenase complex dihydrolipoamide acyltransferase (E2) component